MVPRPMGPGPDSLGPRSPAHGIGPRVPGPWDWAQWAQWPHMSPFGHILHPFWAHMGLEGPKLAKKSISLSPCAARQAWLCLSDRVWLPTAVLPRNAGFLGMASQRRRSAAAAAPSAKFFECTHACMSDACIEVRVQSVLACLRFARVSSVGGIVSARAGHVRSCPVP